MFLIFECKKEVMKENINNEMKQSPFKFWGGWIGAKQHKRPDLVSVYYYSNFPKKTYDLHLYLRKIN